MRLRLTAAAAALLALAPTAASAQGRDAARVLRAIQEEGTSRSQLQRLGQALMDSVGPRLTGSPGQAAAHRWAVEQFRAWSIDARTEPYGTWTGWERGTLHADLVEPRVHSLQARLLSWSPGTSGPVTGEVVAIPPLRDRDELRAWLPSIRGRFVLAGVEPATCRPVENWQQWARPEGLAELAQRTARADSAWNGVLRRIGISEGELVSGLTQSGAAGVLTSDWTGGWGTQRVHYTFGARAPVLDVTCEDFGLLYRLALRRQGPRIRVASTAAFADSPAVTANTVATLRGRQLPDEYVVLSAHFDSWDAASGATDNGTGVLTMMEAARILRTVYPRPRRTIVVGLWGSEEQGLNGSRAFAEDHPEVVDGLQALLNQDTGTGRIERISLQGFSGAGPFWRRWLAALPREVAEGIELDDPGLPSAGSSDHSSFVCRGAPGFWLLSRSWDYGTYTWHTDRDTYDKVAWDDVRRNAVLIAMLAWQAAEDGRVPRTRRDLPAGANGQPGQWPACQPPRRELK
ncbi:MAG TPA: M20/M25/M40 family metallo-hydrolase [Longimicrobium sp.]|uniref:M20/M25/M40 family metallo-hydrolase n=1 Tax=Longimicrobium sp. TaxID=2029185 RepID=UPI002ED8336F